jgi:hypothetical protein
MAKILGEARRSQLVTTYGVGAIIAIEDESFMITGLDQWEAADQDLWIHEPRLERHCRVNHFVLPAASGDDKKDDVPVIHRLALPLVDEVRRCDDDASVGLNISRDDVVARHEPPGEGRRAVVDDDEFGRINRGAKADGNRKT